MTWLILCMQTMKAMRDWADAQACLYLGFMVCQDYFTRFELIQLLGGAKKGDP